MQGLRRSLPARVTAVGFIVVVIAGNLQLAGVLTGAQVAPWITTIYVTGIGIAAAGGIGLGWLILRWIFGGVADKRPDDGPGS